LSAHSSFRLLLKNPPEIFRRPLMPDDTWQERYIIGKDEKSPELRFWLSAARGGDTSSSGILPRRSNPAAASPKSTAAKKKPARKAAKKASKKTAKKTAAKAKESAKKAPKKK